MIRALIIEDEELAARRLANLLDQSKEKVEVLDVLDTVKSAIEWFSDNDPPDLIFLDIQLADGLSFEIFDYVDIQTPILFVTAYDEYAIRAFRLNSIDYLLKPVELEEINKAFDKLKQMKDAFSEWSYSGNTIDMIERLILNKSTKYKNRFIVKVGQHIYPVNSSDILCFSSSDGITYLHTAQKRYPIDFALDKVETLIDPIHFFRINRNYIVRLESIKEMIKYSSNRLKLKLMFQYDDDVIVSRDRMAEFKRWVDG